MKLLRVLKQILFEIFDEAAYRRYCNREGVQRNRASYQAFQAECEQSRQARVKCC